MTVLLHPLVRYIDREARAIIRMMLYHEANEEDDDHIRKMNLMLRKKEANMSIHEIQTSLSQSSFHVRSLSKRF